MTSKRRSTHLCEKQNYRSRGEIIIWKLEVKGKSQIASIEANKN